MKTKRTVITILTILIVTITSIHVNANETTLEETQRYIIKEKAGEKRLGIQNQQAGIEILRTSENLHAVRGTYQDLKTNNNIEIIGIDKQIGIFLQDAVDIVNASSIWNLTVANKTLNGSKRSVCVIDTGVNAAHSDLNGKVLAEYCYCSGTEGAASACCPDGTSEDNNATDNHGHGTHVSGIVAASGGIQGIAHGANIVAIKVLNSTGVGYDSDLKLAIEWCSNDTNIAAYNISAISMSLGGGQYTHQAACVSADSFNVRSAINNAFEKNISVVVATGNTNAVYTNNSAGIASPACLANTTRVTASNKTDWFASYAFRNKNYTDILVAPGSNINSTKMSGGWELRNGTSMATPMISGLIALISQYLNISGQQKTPLEIQTLLNDTGVRLNDSTTSGAYYNRPDGHAALLNIDISSPTTTLVSPSDLSVNASVNQSFTCNTTDWQLANATIYVWNSTGSIHYNNTVNINGETNQTTFTVTNLPLDTYEWNCEHADTKGNSALASSNNSITIGELSVSLTTPTNNTYTNNESVNISCDAYSAPEYQLTWMSGQVWNSSGTLMFNQTKNVSGTQNSSTHNYSFAEEDTYEWNCYVSNNQSNTSSALQNRTITYDNSPPLITALSETGASASSITISWNTSEAANATISGDVSASNNSYSSTHSFPISGLNSATTYSYTITSCDQATNCNSSGGSFTTSSTPSSGGSPGGSSGGTKTTKIQNEELEKGTSKKLAKNDKVTFEIHKQTHSITINTVGKNYAELTIQSDPIQINLSVGEEQKINISSKEYYDLYIKLEEITGLRANITIQHIHETIPTKKTPIPNRTNNEIGIFTENKGETPPQKKPATWRTWVLRILLTGIIGGLILLLILIANGLKTTKHIHKHRKKIKGKEKKKR